MGGERMARRTPEELMRTYLVDVAQHGQLELIDEIAQPDMVDEANHFFGGPAGRDGLRQHVVGFRRYIEDVDIRIERIVAGEDEVMAWWTFSGKHVGPWLGQAPTGAVIESTVFSFFELTDGCISRYRLWLSAGFDPRITFDSSRPVL